MRARQADNSRETLRVEGGSRAHGLAGALDVRQEYYHDKGDGAKWKAIANLMLCALERLCHPYVGHVAVMSVMRLWPCWTACCGRVCRTDLLLC